MPAENTESNLAPITAFLIGIILRRKKIVLRAKTKKQHGLITL